MHMCFWVCVYVSTLSLNGACHMREYISAANGVIATLGRGSEMQKGQPASLTSFLRSTWSHHWLAAALRVWEFPNVIGTNYAYIYGTLYEHGKVFGVIAATPSSCVLIGVETSMERVAQTDEGGRIACQFNVRNGSLMHFARSLSNCTNVCAFP